MFIPMAIAVVVMSCAGPVGSQGVPGPKGSPGPQGETGEPGVSCTVQPTADGLLVFCTDGTQASVASGTVIETVSLCPGASGGVFKEYVVRIGGLLYAVYASGNNIGWTTLSPGNYVTTDGRGCHFTVSQDNQVIY